MDEPLRHAHIIENAGPLTVQIVKRSVLEGRKLSHEEQRCQCSRGGDVTGLLQRSVRRPRCATNAEPRREAMLRKR